jgi:hypothetical protein
MNNTAWQNARQKAELTQVRVHDLKHTFGGACALRGYRWKRARFCSGTRPGTLQATTAPRNWPS